MFISKVTTVTQYLIYNNINPRWCKGLRFVFWACCTAPSGDSERNRMCSSCFLLNPQLTNQIALLKSFAYTKIPEIVPRESFPWD